MGDIMVTVPARPEFVHVLRSVIASVAARLNFPFDGIDDLRIAVDEASAHLLQVGADPRHLMLRIRPSDGEIEVEAAVDVNADDWPREGAKDTLTWQVLSSLVDEATFERTDDGPAIRFVKRV